MASTMFQQSNNINSVNQNQQLKITENDRKDFSIAFNECWDRLKLNNYYVCDNDETPTLTWRSAIVSQDMYNFMVTIFENMSKYLVDNVVDATVKENLKQDDKVDDNTLEQKTEDNISQNNIIIFNDEPFNEVEIDRVANDEATSEVKYTVCNKFINTTDKSSSKKINKDTDNAIGSTKSSSNSPSTSPPNSLQKKNRLSLDEKIKVLNLVSENPSWTLDEIRKNTGYHQIFSFNQLSEWLEHVKNGGTVRDMMNKLYDSVYEKFVEAKNNNPNKKISNDMLRQWGLEAKKTYSLNGSIGKIKFEASIGWLKKFKLRYNIVGNKSDLQVGNQKRSQRLKKDNVDVDVDVAGQSTGLSKQSVSTKQYKKAAKKIEPLVANKKRERSLTLQEKQRVVNMAREHPSWNLRMLKKMSGSKHLRSIDSLRRWEIQLEDGGSIFDKKVELRNWVLSNFLINKKNNIKITNDMITNWSIEGQKKFKLPDSNFCPTTWIRTFKIKHHIFGDEFDLQIKNLSNENS
ncbi:hypothetical protein HCN44_004462 [Aphidius gifuensis]|uniref:HTH CENPB-type domain-containing protein n=1 Tax=Aphidius gifuensis TaxID=684658 RepID=A0A834XZM1_APHGI|nr:hypothetical protein HCN44_004462 [Aphidius gifuensis]